MDDNKCLKEYMNNDCYKVDLKYQKGKIHVTYLLIIAVILIVISISIRLGDDTVLSGQLSMASTFSSIILSAIAIFMSISGERKTDSIKDQLIETASKLEKTTNHVQSANQIMQSELNESIKNTKDLYSELFGKLSDMDKKVVESMESIKNNISVQKTSSDLNSDIILEKLYLGVRKQFSRSKAIDLFDDIIIYSAVCIGDKEGEEFNIDEIRQYLNDLHSYTIPDVVMGIIWGSYTAITPDGGIGKLIEIVKKYNYTEQNIIIDENLILNNRKNYLKNK